MVFRRVKHSVARQQDDIKESDELIEVDGVGEDDKVVLRRFMGLGQTVSFIMGIIIGTGIFLTPAGVLRGSSGSIGIALMVWVVGAGISAAGAVCLIELALYYRQSGGMYVYLRRFYGPAAGFIYISVSLLVFSPCGTAVSSIVVVKFLVTPFIGDCDAVPEYAFKAGASCVYLLAVFINCQSAKGPVKIQVFLTFIKVGAVSLVIMMGAVMVITEGTGKFMAPFDASGPEGFQWSKLPSAFFAAYYTLSGWSYVGNITEEIKNPQKTLVRAMLISLICITALFMLANLAYFVVLTPAEMMASDAVAALFAVRVVGVRWSFIIWLSVVLSAAGSVNSSCFTESRTFFAAARAKQLPFIISTIHVKRRTPLAALLCPVPFVLIYIWCADVWFLINLTTSFGTIVDILVNLSIPYLRWTQPNRKLPYKAPLWACFTYIVFNVVVLSATIFTDTAQAGFTVLITLISLFAYYFYGWTSSSPRAMTVSGPINNFLQKLLFSVHQEVATF